MNLLNFRVWGSLLMKHAVPVDDPVRGLCEVLGFDPFNLANEGKVLFVAGKDEQGEDS